MGGDIVMWELHCHAVRLWGLQLGPPAPTPCFVHPTGIHIYYKLKRSIYVHFYDLVSKISIAILLVIYRARHRHLRSNLSPHTACFTPLSFPHENRQRSLPSFCIVCTFSPLSPFHSLLCRVANFVWCKTSGWCVGFDKKDPKLEKLRILFPI